MVHLAVLCLAAQAHAAFAPSFEGALGEFRGAFLAVRAVQREVGVISRADMDARRLRWDAQAHKRDLAQLAARARRYRPPERGRSASDPSLGSDLRFFVWRVQNHARDAQRLEAAVRGIPGPVPPDSDQAAAARALADSARWLESDEGWLESDARFAAWDFRRAGFSFEGWDVERAASDARRAAAAAEAAARRLAGLPALQKKRQVRPRLGLVRVPL